MSIHGIQKFFPFVLGEDLRHLESPIDFLIGINELIKRKNSNEKIKSISRLAWPLILIHGTENSHIVIDDVGISNLEMEVANPPRKGVIGHILRNIDNRSYNEMLEKIIDIITYTEEGKAITTEWEKEEERKEYRKVIIKGLMGPQIIEGLEKLVKNLFEAPISEYNLLESQYSVEKGLDFAQEFQKLISDIRGTKVQWNDLHKVIQEPFNEWINELNAQIKDTEIRYKKSILKEKSTISKETVDELMKKAHQDIEQWVLREKKNVLEKIGGSFLPIDIIMENIRNKNAEFINTDSFKTLNIDVAIEKASDHIKNIKNSLDDLNQKWEQLQENFNMYIDKIRQIDEEAQKRINEKELELKTKLAQRDARIHDISKKSNEFIAQLKNAKESLSRKLKKIYEIIDKKMSECDKELNELMKWGLNEQKSNINQTVIRLFLPVYVALLEDEEEDEERIIFSFPCIINKKLEATNVSEGFSEFKEKAEKIIEDDMKIRSNFEFTIDKNNLLVDEKLEKKILEAERLLKMLGYKAEPIKDNVISLLK
ncbi:MAG: hypothetical protein ACTSRZ_01975 [Promethearchaeota archaeon]